MQRISFPSHLLKEPVKSKANSAWELLSEEIAEKYQVAQKRFRWLFWKVPEDKVRQAFKTAGTIEDLIKHSLSK